MKNVISQSLGLDLININVYAKVYPAKYSTQFKLSTFFDIFHEQAGVIFTFSEFEPRQRLGQS